MGVSPSFAFPKVFERRRRRRRVSTDRDREYIKVLVYKVSLRVIMFIALRYRLHGFPSRPRLRK